ncbi:MAG: M56 family metallopeptidase, partial [Bacillota bacterium]|nr:M56 family metallopeptidase [Bacillota bacterium]
MLKNLFNVILSLSFAGTVASFIILIFRKIAGRMFSPRWRYLIWFILILKLAVPITIASNVSVFNLVKPTDNFSSINNSTDLKYIYTNVPTVPSKESIFTMDASQYPVYADTEERSKTDWIMIGSLFWLIGFISFIAAAIISYLGLYRNTKSDIPCKRDYLSGLLEVCRNEANIKRKISIRCVAGNIQPCVIGAIKPCIIIPYISVINLDESSLKIIIMHELMHIKHWDYIVRLLSYLVHAEHWFNPIVWISFRKMAKDCEIACDTDVVRNYPGDMRKEYASALLGMAQMMNNRYSFIRTPSFGESDLKKRIVNVVNYKKHSAFAIIASAILALSLIFVVSTGAVLKKDSMVSGNFRDVDTIKLSIDLRYLFINPFTQMGYDKFKVSSSDRVFYSIDYPYLQRTLKADGNDAIDCRLIYDCLVNNSENIVKENKVIESQPDLKKPLELQPNLKIEIKYKDHHIDYIYSSNTSLNIQRSKHYYIVPEYSDIMNSIHRYIVSYLD